MASIFLENVSLQLPILHAGHRSFKKTVLSTAMGGAILRESHKVPTVQALRGISGHFISGDRIGLIGPNGAGKSTLLRTIAGIYEPTDGSMHSEGSIMPLLDIGLGFNLNMTGRENIQMQGMYLGYKPAALEQASAEIEEFTELGDYLDLPVRTYSAGMQMRVSMAVATALRPEILLMDEWLLAGDESFLAKAQSRLEKFVGEVSILLLASHAEAIIRQWCNKVIYLAGGELRYAGGVDHAFAEYHKDIRARK